MSDGELVRAIVPIRGSTARMSCYSRLRPPLLTVDLPHANAGLPLGIHSVRREGIREILIGARSQGGITIRFSFLHRRPEVRAVEVDRGMVRVTFAMVESP